jgi:hypothetical protein
LVVDIDGDRDSFSASFEPVEIGSAIDTRRERERDEESMREKEREEISWECYFDVWCIIKL